MFGIGGQELGILAIIIIVAVIFLFPKVFRNRIKGPEGSKWKLRIGVFQAVIAFSAFIWARGHSPYRGLSELLTVRWVFKEEIYILTMVGLAILALLGIGNIVIGVLNSATEKHAKQKTM